MWADGDVSRTGRCSKPEALAASSIIVFAIICGFQHPRGRRVLATGPPKETSQLFSPGLTKTVSRSRYSRATPLQGRPSHDGLIATSNRGAEGGDLNPGLALGCRAVLITTPTVFFKTYCIWRMNGTRAFRNGDIPFPIPPPISLLRGLAYVGLNPATRPPLAHPCLKVC